MNFVTIKKSHYESDLLIIKGKLESEGIPCFLKNEYTTQAMNYMATFVVELQVSEPDLEKAKEILNEIDSL